MFSLTLEERERRWNNIREAMDKRGLECLIVWGSTGFHHYLCAHLKYLCNTTSEGYLVFPLQGGPTLIRFFGRPDPTSWVVDNRTGHPKYSELITERLKEMHLENARIGIVELSGYDGELGFPYTTYIELLDNFPSASFEDATEIMVEARRIKSAAEIRCFELGCEIGEKASQSVIDNTRAGMPDYEVRARIMDTLFREGGEPGSMLFCHSGKEIIHGAQGGLLKPRGLKVLEKGDVILTEFDASYLGYIAQYNQPFSIGKPSKEWREIFSVATEAFNSGFNALRPGITAGELDAAILSPIEKAGYIYRNPPFHGLGLSIEEPIGSFPAQPKYKPDHSVIIEPGMVFEFEPHVLKPDFKKGATVGSPVLVTETGCRLLSKTWKPEVGVIPA